MADEEKLVRKAQKGDVEAFEKIISDYRSLVFNVSYRFSGNAEDAADMSQEIFIKLFKNINSFRFQSKLSTWIYKIATNTCLDIVKKKKRDLAAFSLDSDMEDEDGKSFSSEVADSAPTPDVVAERNEMTNAVNRAISMLPDDYRFAIILRDIQGLSYDDIAEVVDCSVGTVKSRISRGRKNLREILLKDRELFDNFFV